MTGILYGVGVGPGEPELLTVKAVRLIRENEVIALPASRPCETVAYRIAVQAVPELAKKELLALHMPMTHDPAEREASHERAAALVEAVLRQGRNVVFLTLGDPTIYSTFSYVEKRIARRGYQTEFVPGIPSFCAAAARLGTPLTEWDEPLHVYPAMHRLELNQPGTCVLMKSGRKLAKVREDLKESGREVLMVENCGMEGERIYRGADEIPADAGYYTLILAKERR